MRGEGEEREGVGETSERCIVKEYNDTVPRQRIQFHSRIHTTSSGRRAPQHTLPCHTLQTVPESKMQFRACASTSHHA